jgi:hypothetical protein
MIEIVEYADDLGKSPFRLWFDGLDRQAAVGVTIAVNRLGAGNVSNAKPGDPAWWWHQEAAG